MLVIVITSVGEDVLAAIVVATSVSPDTLVAIVVTTLVGEDVLAAIVVASDTLVLLDFVSVVDSALFFISA